MRLSIIIPQYKESETMLKRLLNSIDFQRQIDFNELEVIFVNDKSDYPPPESLKSLYPFKIEIHQTEVNGGPGMARQYGIERAKGDYILFIDADDMLISCIALRTIFNYKGDADIIRCKFFNESNNVVDNGWTWVHGKFYKRQFIIDTGLCFPPELRVNEDAYFNMLAGAYTDKIEDINEIVTFWAKNPNSITRTNSSEFALTCYGDYIKGKLLGFRQLYIKGRFDVLRANLVHFLVYSYYYLQVAEFKTEKGQEYKRNYEISVAKILKEFYNIFMQVSDADIDVVLNSEYKVFANYVNYRLGETFDMFMQNLYEKEI